jgi:hypothetical protein
MRSSIKASLSVVPREGGDSITIENKNKYFL